MPDSLWQNRNPMDSADLSTLYSVASQCYVRGGPAVFLARSMYWTAVRDNTTPFWDDCVNPIDEDKMLSIDNPNETIQDSMFLFKVYPNPMDKENSLNVLCSESGNISFYNLLGQITYTGQLQAGINIFNCSQLSCETGIVLYKAKMQKGRIETGKVVTIK